jgi:hypothetical protein
MTLRSDTYAVYAKVLDDLYSVVDAIDSGLISSQDHGIPRLTSLYHRPALGPPSGSHGRRDSTAGLGADARSPSCKSSKPNRRRLFHQGNFGENRVAKANRPKREGSYEVDCPDHKHHMMYLNSQDSSCQGCREKFMSQVRSHLIRIDHGGRSGAWQCSCCKKDFDDQQEFETHKAVRACSHRPLRRGGIVLQWARLYLIRYPNATRIPTPCRFPANLSTQQLTHRSL